MSNNLKISKNVTPKRTDRNFKIRAKQMLSFLFALFVLVGGFRLGYITLLKGEEYRSKAEKNQLYDQIIPAVRGTIYDCNKTPLVTSSSAWILTVNPSEIYNFFKVFDVVIDEENKIVDTTKSDIERERYYQHLSKKLAKILGMKKKEVYEIITNKEKIYSRIKRKIDATTRLELDKYFEYKYTYDYGKTSEDDKKLTARRFFTYENDTIRLYPDNNFASTIIGVTNYDGDGAAGVELKYNSVLKGVDGRRVTAKDAMNNEIDASYETIFDAQEGNGVVLTIDSNIQMYLENALSQAFENTGAKGTYGIVMDVDTGAVLAISDKPDFDLNDPYTLIDKSAIEELEKYKDTDEFSIKQTEALYNQWNSFCITSTYEPGSTFKIFTASAALEEGIANLGTTYTCSGGYKIPNGPIIHCANTDGHGTQTFTQGLMNSCNPFFINLGQKMGAETFYKYFQAFGFTEKTGIDLSGEASPIYHSLSNLKVTELASTSFGQSFRISPIQLITAACAIANGGKLMTPYVVDSIVDTNGNIISKTEPIVKRQVISESTAATVRSMMEAVVEGGTGKNSYIPGYRVAGKTATSEKLDDAGGTDQMKYVASFVCFAPADDPEVAILVGVDEPPGTYRGGGVLAAPIAKEVMESTLKYLNVQPQYTASELQNVSKKAPSLIGETIAAAKQTAANSGLTVKVIGSGEKVISQVPASGQSIPEGGIVVVYTEESTETVVVEVPDFSGMSVSKVNKLAHEVGINVIISGPAKEAGAESYNQNIAKGTSVAPGSSVTVYFHTTTQTAD